MNKAKWVKCTGEAHSSEVAGNIDHCGICMPYWEYYPVCPVHRKRLTEKGLCHECRKYYEVNIAVKDSDGWMNGDDQ